MAGPEAESVRQFLARAVTLPITNFKPGAQRLEGREERIAATIKNVESHQNAVRHRIVGASLSELPEMPPNAYYAQAPPEALAVYAGLRRSQAYEQPLETKRALIERLARGSGGEHNPPAAAAQGPDVNGVRASALVAPTVPATTAMVAQGVAPTALMMRNAPPSASNIDASRDPRRR